jgi:hypothetical protein
MQTLQNTNAANKCKKKDNTVKINSNTCSNSQWHFHVSSKQEIHTMKKNGNVKYKA